MVKSDGPVVKVKANIVNTGEREGAAVIQVYAGSDLSSTGEDRPLRQLKGFQRVEINPGESVPVEISVPIESLRFRHDGRWVLDARYNFFVGLDSREALSCKTTIEL